MLPAAQGPHLPGHIAAGWWKRGDLSARCSNANHQLPRKTLPREPRAGHLSELGILAEEDRLGVALDPWWVMAESNRGKGEDWI